MRNRPSDERPGAAREPIKVACPSCAEELQLELLSTVDVVADPGLLGKVRDGSLQRHSCELCGASFQIQAPFLYLDAREGLLIQVAPPADLVRWREIEATLGSYGDKLRFAGADEGDSDGEAQGDTAADEDVLGEANARLQRRLVFGLNHLNEKIFLAEHGFDDRSVELLKLSLLATRKDLAEHLRGAAPEFLVEGLSGNDIVFLLVTYDVDGHAQRAQLPVPRALYDAVERDPDFAGNFTELRDAWFVSWLRYVEMTTPEEAPKA